MSGFYSQGGPAYNNPGTGGGSGGSGGFYNSNTATGYGGQQQQQSQTSTFMQPGTGFSNPNMNSQNNNNSNNMYQQPQNSQQQYHQPSAMMQSSMSYPNQQQQPQASQQQAYDQFKSTADQVKSTALSHAMSAFATGKVDTNKVMEDASNIFKSGIPGVDGIMNTLRDYFAVDNRYVKRKMQKCLFPFFPKQDWIRFRVEGPPDRENFALPLADVNAPDLYLPIMSLITYCLLCALCYGTAGEFNPEVIADVTTKCFITQLLEVAIIRFGFYMMQASIPFLDLFAYTGYKYLGLTVNILFGILFGYLDWGRSAYYATFLWTASAASYFMLKTMANNIPIETASTGPKREVMVLAFAASQAASMWFVGQTKFL